MIVLNWCQVIIRDELLGARHPVAERQVENWGPKQYLEDHLRQTVIIHWWLLVRVIQTARLKNVKHKELCAGNREQDWNTVTKHHGHKANVEHLGILVVERELRALVDVNVGLDCSLPSCIARPHVVVTIVEALDVSQEPITEPHYDREINIQHHGADQSRGRSLEKGLVEVWILTLVNQATE